MLTLKFVNYQNYNHNKMGENERPDTAGISQLGQAGTGAPSPPPEGCCGRRNNGGYTCAPSRTRGGCRGMGLKLIHRNKSASRCGVSGQIDPAEVIVSVNYQYILVLVYHGRETASV